MIAAGRRASGARRWPATSTSPAGAAAPARRRRRALPARGAGGPEPRRRPGRARRDARGECPAVPRPRARARRRRDGRRRHLLAGAARAGAPRRRRAARDLRRGRPRLERDPDRARPRRVRRGRRSRSDGTRAGARARCRARGRSPADAAGVHDWSGGGADAGLEASGHRDGFEALIAALRPGGRVVCCGYAPGSTYELDSMRLVLAELVGARLASELARGCEARARLGRAGAGDADASTGPCRSSA